MKKLFLNIIFILFILPNLFGFSWYYFVGKKVDIKTISSEYVGIVRDIIEIDICKQKDSAGNCILKEYYCNIVLYVVTGQIVCINCEHIVNIEEIK